MKQSFTRLLLLPIVLFAYTSTLWADEEILVYTKDLADPYISLWVSKRPTISFEQKGISIVSTELETTIELEVADISRIEFKESPTKTPDYVSDIEEAASFRTKNLLFSYVDGEHITIEGIGSETTIKLYGIDGKCQLVDAVNNSGVVNISLSHLPKGYYIINVGNQPFKVYKK